MQHYSGGDAVAEAYAMVMLVDGGYATQGEVANAFRSCERTVRRHLKRYHDGGMRALATRCGWRAGRRRIPTKRAKGIEWFERRFLPAFHPVTILALLATLVHCRGLTAVAATV